MKVARRAREVEVRAVIRHIDYNNHSHLSDRRFKCKWNSQKAVEGWRGDLAISNRPRDHKLASAIADCGFYEFKRQLIYKCEWYGSRLVIAPRFYPSSQICSPYRASTENAVA